MKKIAAFIDAPNLQSAARGLGMTIDYKKLLTMITGQGNLIRAFYYTALIEDDNEVVALRPLVDWLEYNGYTVITKPGKEFTDASGGRKIKGNMDIEIAVDMMELAPRLDHIYLFSGDGDFRSLVEAVQRKGVRVTVISTLESPTPMIAKELRRQADEFVDLATIQSLIEKQDTVASLRRKIAT